jgi:hypothetical protein
MSKTKIYTIIKDNQITEIDNDISLYIDYFYSKNIENGKIGNNLIDTKNKTITIDNIKYNFNIIFNEPNKLEDEKTISDNIEEVNDNIDEIKHTTENIDEIKHSTENIDKIKSTHQIETTDINSNQINDKIDNQIDNQNDNQFDYPVDKQNEKTSNLKMDEDREITEINNENNNKNKDKDKDFTPISVPSSAANSPPPPLSDEDELKINIEKIEIVENSVENKTICSNKFAGYLIKTTRSNGDIWYTWKRYSEFHKLNDGLKKESNLIVGSILDAITFPPKRFFSNLSPKIINQRQLSLENYLNQLLNITLIAKDSLQFRDFLSPSTRFNWIPREINVEEYKHTGNKIKEIDEEIKKKTKKKQQLSKILYLKNKYSGKVNIEYILPKLNQNILEYQDNDLVKNKKMFQLHHHLSDDDVLDLLKIKNLNN